MMLKIILFGYSQKIYSCRGIEKLIQENLKKYQNKKNQSGYEQSFKIYECENCTDCSLKAKCRKAKGNRQVHWNTVFEEMKAKAKTALECEETAAIYARRKIEVESVFSHIKGNRSFRRFFCRVSTRCTSSLGLWR